MGATSGYIRVSHEESALSGVSPESQKQAIIAYREASECPKWSKLRAPSTARRGLFVDLAQSAWKVPILRRPSGSVMCQSVQPGDHIIMYSLDRGFRSVLDFAATTKSWIDQDISVHFIREQLNMASANGRLMANMLAAVAQWQSDIKSERIKEGLAAKRSADHKPGTRTPRIKYRTPKNEWKPCEIDWWGGMKEEVQHLEGGTIHMYCRVSHEKSLKGYGLQAQQQKLMKYATYLKTVKPHLTIGHFFSDEAVSAYTKTFLSRPQGGALHNALEPGDHIIVPRLDRGWRSIRDMLETVELWTKMGVTVHFADQMLDISTAMGSAFLKILCVSAELESSLKSEHLKQINRQRRLMGRPTSKDSPLGTRIINVNGRKQVVLDAEKVRIIWWAHHMYHNHGMGTSSIATHLSKIYAPKKPGRKQKRLYHNDSVRHMVLRWDAIKDLCDKIRNGTYNRSHVYYNVRREKDECNSVPIERSDRLEEGAGGV